MGPTDRDGSPAGSELGLELELLVEDVRVTVGSRLDQFHGARCDQPADRLGPPGDRKLDKHALVGELADPVNCEDCGLPVPVQ